MLDARARGIEQTDRDFDKTSREFTERGLLHAANAFGATLAAVISFIWSWTDSRMLTLIPFCLSVAYWSGGWARHYFRRMNRLRLHPRIPEDLVREPSVLYLRPHPDDTEPRSPWRGPLDFDIAMLCPDTHLFRVGHMPDVPPPKGLARLPLSADDWRSTLAAALPRCHLVMIPATGTSPDTLAQLAEAMHLLPPARLLLLLSAREGADKEYASFRKAFAAHARSLSPANGKLPDLPVKLPPRRGETALRGVIHFANDWTPAVLRFSSIAPETYRGPQLRQVKAELEQFLMRRSFARKAGRRRSARPPTTE